MNEVFAQLLQLCLNASQRAKLVLERIGLSAVLSGCISVQSVLGADL